MEQLHFLVMGTGVIGQAYGLHLQMAGHRVTFLTREKYLDRFKREGITLYCIGAGVKPFCTKKIEAMESQFVTELTSLEGVDYVFACFRGDQREETARILEALAPKEVAKPGLVLCFPFWSNSDVEFVRRFKHSYSMLPGISGVYRSEGKTDALHPHIYRSTTRLSPLVNPSLDEIHKLTSLLTKAGLPTIYMPNLLTVMDIIMAASFPFFAALSTRDYKASALKDRKLTELAFRAQKECLEIVELGGTLTGLVGKFLHYMPVPVMTSLVSASAFLIRGLIREMLEVHFKKVHSQTIFLLKELAAFPFADKVKKENLEKILAIVNHCLIA